MYNVEKCNFFVVFFTDLLCIFLSTVIKRQRKDLEFTRKTENTCHFKGKTFSYFTFYFCFPGCWKISFFTGFFIFLKVQSKNIKLQEKTADLQENKNVE